MFLSSERSILLNTMMKRIFQVIAVAAILLSGLAVPPAPVQAADTATLEFFYGETCPHCAKEEVFLDDLQAEFGEQLVIERYEVYFDADNQKLYQQRITDFAIQNSGVPLTIVGDEYIVGFNSAETTGTLIRSWVQAELGHDAVTVVDGATEVEYCDDDESIICAPGETADSGSAGTEQFVIDLPFFGPTDLTTFSLPVLAIVIGTIDGFNPCAMWVLVFLISLLFGVTSQSRRWLIGGIFIGASGLVYFLFMAAWLQFFLFLSYLTIVRVAIGLFALGFGIYNLYEYYKSRKEGLVCKITSNQKRQNTFDKLRQLVQQKHILIALAGIIALAFAVNLVELACSAGFPAIFTSVLAYSGVGPVDRYLLIALYILFFMIDDLIVFIIAMVTLKQTNISVKYAQWSKLIGGVIILLLGLLLMFKPEWLSF